MVATTKDAYDLLHQGTLTLARIEANGIRIDTDYLDSVIVDMTAEISNLVDEIKDDPIYATWQRRFGRKTNIGAPDQLAYILYDVKKLECKHRTKTGKPKMDDETLKSIDDPFVNKYREVSKLKKVNNTFLKGIREEVVNGFLHPFYNLNTTETFRSSSNNPNFQNFPSRNKRMKKIVKSAFIPRKGRQLGEIDFKAIEVAIAACYHKDPTMITYLKDPSKDMHRDMAMDCYCLTKEEVNSDSRYCAKNKFVFPQFYGDFYPRCAASMWRAIEQMNLVVGDPKSPEPLSLKDHLKSKGITKLGKCDPEQRPVAGSFEKHIKDIEDNFWNNRFPVYAQWKKDWWNAYKRNGFFRTKTGFLISGVYRRNQVINYPVQGSAFHCLLWTLIKLQAWLDKKRMKSLIVGQIHDSMLIDFHPPEIPRILKKIKRLVTEELPAHWKWINVPLSVEIEIAPLGKSWFDKVEVKI